MTFDSLVRYLREETDGSRYQRLNRESLLDGDAVDDEYKRALRIVLAETKT